MLINPILVVSAAVILGFGLIYCLINRPKIPILTLLFLLLLICFLAFTAILNGALEPSSPSFSGPDQQLGTLISFLVGKPYPTQEQCEQAFLCYQSADIVLFIGTLVSMGIEIWKIVVKPSFKKEEKKNPL